MPALAHKAPPAWDDASAEFVADVAAAKAALKNVILKRSELHEAMVELGRVLAKWKERLPHGRFLAFLGRVDVNVHTAERAMRLYREGGKRKNVRQIRQPVEFGSAGGKSRAVACGASPDKDLRAGDEDGEGPMSEAEAAYWDRKAREEEEGDQPDKTPARTGSADAGGSPPVAGARPDAAMVHGPGADTQRGPAPRPRPVGATGMKFEGRAVQLTLEQEYRHAERSIDRAVEMLRARTLDADTARRLHEAIDQVIGDAA